MHFDSAWSETIALRNGRAIQLRLLRKEDSARLQDGFTHLSPQARYQRFHGVRNELSAAELRYLTELDGVHHFALVAADAKTGQGLAVARFVELAPGIAEPAVTVVDEAQGQGLGRLLLDRLMAAARERGIRHLRFEVLAENQAMRGLLLELAPNATIERDGIELVIDMPLEPAASGLQRLLAAAAKGLFVLLSRSRDKSM